MSTQIEMPDSAGRITPFLKWAGGKRWLSNRISVLAQPLDGKYIEPFLGSAAVFFHLRPDSAVLSDTNADLINAFMAVRDDFQRVFELLVEHQKKHSVDYFYKMRAYKPRCEYRMAARLIYLNRTCWNGLYRVNLAGEFNVPIGTKNTVLMPSDNWEEASRALSKADIRCCDFEISIDKAKRGDLIFADPPYTVKHNLNGFIKYNDALFSWADQIRLRDALVRARSRGARTIITNAHHQSVRDLYRDEFEFEAVTRASVLAGSPTHRGRYEELLIR